MNITNRKESAAIEIPEASQGRVSLLEPSFRIKRRGRKRTRFELPREPARSVKSLWESANEEEKARAHKTCMAILEMWLGKKAKGEVASELSLSPIRVWQLSQSALSGMLCGLLKQPRTRGKIEEMARDPDNDPRVLRARIKKLESQLELTEDLVRVLKDLPWNRGADFEGIEEFLRARRAKLEKETRRARRGGRSGREAQREGGGMASDAEKPPAG